MMKVDLDNVRDFLGHKFSAYQRESYYYVCDICGIVIFFTSNNHVVIVDQITDLCKRLDFDAEILDCNNQQIKNLLE